MQISDERFYAYIFIWITVSVAVGFLGYYLGFHSHVCRECPRIEVMYYQHDLRAAIDELLKDEKNDNSDITMASER